MKGEERPLLAPEIVMIAPRSRVWWCARAWLISAALAESDPVLIVNYGGRSDVTLAYVVSRRSFTGNWEYLLDRAIFTSPPTLNWSGAALIGKDGSLLGVGSLILRDATAADPHLPGNMFVPVELLTPILPDLVKSGRRAGPARPWLGVAAD